MSTRCVGAILYGLVSLAVLLGFGAWSASSDAGGRAVSFVEVTIALGMLIGVCPVFPDLLPADDGVVVTAAEMALARAKGWSP